MGKNEGNRTACEAYEARLEDYLEGLDPAGEVRVHIERCAACREALEVARTARGMLREAIPPAGVPGGAFATRVLAQIRAQESEQRGLWRALEILGSRLAMTAAMAVLLLTLYVGVTLVRHQNNGAPQADVGDGYSAMTGQPSSGNELLLTMAESGHGR